MTCDQYDFTILKGKTFSRILRWETGPIIYKPITGITQAAPAVLTVAAHGVVDGWRVAVVSVRGMTEINAKYEPPRTPDYHKATVLSSGTIELNDVNSAEFKAWTSGGYVQYNTPVDLAGYTARMQIRTSTEATAFLLELVTELPDPRIVIDNALKTITLTVPATDTAAITWGSGVYDLELISSAGVVTQLLQGTVTASEEATK